MHCNQNLGASKGKVMDLYRWLWERLGKRPFTFILRDLWTQLEWLWQLVFFSLGVIVCFFFGWKVALIAFGIYTIGFIGGHIWWGTKHIPGQKG